MVTYEELAKIKVVGPRAVQIKELLKDKPMNVDEISANLGITKAAIRPYLRDIVAKDEDIGKVRIGRKVYYYSESILRRFKER
ncbi:MAG: ArsR family transcriptional regulator [Candidatus Bathyarchaeia archaeon]